MKIDFVILTLNEINGLTAVFPKISCEGLHKIFAVDGGSTDGTLAFFDKHNIPVIGQSKKGRGEAMRLAVKQSDADAFIFFSPDGNEDPKDIPRFIAFLEEGYDLVIASRMMAGAVNEEDIHWFRPRKWANNFFNWWVNLMWNRGPYITDSINGFRGVTKKAFEQLACDENGFTIEYQMTIRALKQKLRIYEFPTFEGQRIGGQTGAKAIPTGMKFIRLFLRECRQ